MTVDLDAHYPALVYYAEALIAKDPQFRHRRDAAGDLVHDTIVALMEKYGHGLGFDPAKVRKVDGASKANSLLAYLKGCIAAQWTRAVRRQWQRDERRRAGDNPLDVEDIDIERFRILVDSLPPPDGDLLVARYLREQSWNDIAATSGMTPVAARQRVSRLLRQLRSNKMKAPVTKGKAGGRYSVDESATSSPRPPLAASF
jgi:RNA polymerase sigma factor (sigma-70 family)